MLELSPGARTASPPEPSRAGKPGGLASEGEALAPEKVL